MWTHPIPSLGCSKYIIIIVDDYSRFTWISFLKEKNEAFKEFSNICKQLQVCTNSSIVFIRSGYGREFDKKKILLNFATIMELLTISQHHRHSTKWCC